MKNYNKILEAVNRGIKFALDDFEDNEIQGQVNSKIKYQGGTKEYLDLMEEVVDLGLPSGTLWCKYNLGATCKPNNNKSWYGNYYAWGETSTKTFYGWVDPYDTNQNYKYANGSEDTLTKYCHKSRYGLNGFTDNLTQLLPEDDAAYQNKKLYNYKFHIPTKEQCEELINYTKNYWVHNYDPDKLVHNPKDDGGIQELNGRIFEGKNKNQLFIPAAGIRQNFYCSPDGSYCRIWSSNLCLDNCNKAYYLDFNIINTNISMYERRCGYSVRPVINL